MTKIEVPATSPDRRGRFRLGPKLYKTGRGEVAVERERLCDSKATHHSKARGVHKRIHALIVPPQPVPGFALHGLVYMVSGETRRMQGGVGESPSFGVSEPSVQESPSFTQHVVRGGDSLGPVTPQRDRIRVMGVALELKRDPERSVDEPQGPYTSWSTGPGSWS